MMKERPILMSAPMVRAILDGTKTQTRRAIKPVGNDGGFVLLDHGDGLWTHRSDDGDSTFHTVKRGGKEYLDETPHMCPYGQPGDRLWVRETWQHSNFPLGPYDESCIVFYRADYMDDPHGPDGELSPEGAYRKWRPSIHMPRLASRITLEITGVRVERLQDISEADCIGEGAHGGHGAIAGYTYSATPLEHYRYIWESINGAGSWDANPWVWVIEFRSRAGPGA